MKLPSDMLTIRLQGMSVVFELVHDLLLSNQALAAFHMCLICEVLIHPMLPPATALTSLMSHLQRFP